MNSKLSYFKNLYNNHRELTLLQWLYALIAIIGVFVAGIIALMNQSLGISILIVPGVFAIAFIANLVAWSLLNTVLKSLFIEEAEKGSKNTKQ